MIETIRKIRNRQADWFDALVAKGHTPITNEAGGLDIFVCDVGKHNGPGCQTCDWSDCWHCLKVADIPECTKGAKP